MPNLVQEHPNRHARTVKLRKTGVDGFLKEIAKLNKKAIEYGLEEIKIGAQKETHWVYVHDSITEEKSHIYLKRYDPVLNKDNPIVTLYEYDIEYPIIKKNGWEVIGKKSAEDIGTIQFSFSDNEEDKNAISQYTSNGKICCDHCNTNRPRLSSFILKSQEEGYKEVGSSCLEDYTGIDPSQTKWLAKMSTIFSNCDADLENMSGGTNHSFSVSLKSFLEVVAHLVEKEGYISKSQAEEKITASTCETAVYILTKGNSELCRSNENQKKAEDAINWAASHQNPKNDPYISNIKLIANSEVISLDAKYIGFATSIIAAYEREKKALEAKSKSPSVHFGEVAQKIDCDLELKHVHSYDSQFGVQNICIFSDSKGNQVKWKTSSLPDEIRNHCDTLFPASFKVKAHEDYNGIAQTVVTHLKAQIPPQIIAKLSKATALEWDDFTPPPASATPHECIQHYAIQTMESGDPAQASYFNWAIGCDAATFIKNDAKLKGYVELNENRATIQPASQAQIKENNLRNEFSHS